MPLGTHPERCCGQDTFCVRVSRRVGFLSAELKTKTRTFYDISLNYPQTVITTLANTISNHPPPPVPGYGHSIQQRGRRQPPGRRY